MERIKVNIDGMDFYVVGSEDKEAVEDMACELTERIQETNKTNYRLNQVQGLVLTALNLLNDLHETEKNMESLVAKDPENQKTHQLQEEKEALKEEVEELKEQKAKLEDRFSGFQREKEDLDKDLRSTKASLEKLKRDLRDSQEKARVLEEKEKGYEDKIYQDQLTIVDLQKELSLLKGREDE